MFLVQALKKARGNQSQAARILGIHRVTVWNRMKK
ncbi:MAG: helix-turn-helix domain-containing protein [Desulfobacterales bacterium]